MWLRLVNTSLEAAQVTSNLALAAGAGAPASVAARQVAATLLADAVSLTPRLQPPWLCDAGALQRALILVQGPAAFDMLR